MGSPSGRAGSSDHPWGLQLEQVQLELVPELVHQLMRRRRFCRAGEQPPKVPGKWTASMSEIHIVDTETIRRGNGTHHAHGGERCDPDAARRPHGGNTACQHFQIVCALGTNRAPIHLDLSLLSL